MTLVSHKHQFVFLKTRKTAGTSIEMLLEPFCAPPGHVPVERTEGMVTPHGVIGHRLQPIDLRGVAEAVDGDDRRCLGGDRPFDGGGIENPDVFATLAGSVWSSISSRSGKCFVGSSNITC